MRIAVVDYGVGNIFSVQAALRELRIGFSLDIDGSGLAHADVVLVPGVAAFGTGVRMLRQSGQFEAITAFAATGRPLLGLCLGAQVFLESSEEAPGVAGLGLVPGSVVRLDPSACRVPNQGWLRVRPTDSARSDLPALVEDGAYYYFSHSYRMHMVDAGTVLATAHADRQGIVAVYRSANVMGVQFHPELSGATGLGFLSRLIASVR